MNAALPKFAMVMTSDDTDVKRSTRELRQDLANVGQAAAGTAPAFDAQAEATNRATVAARQLADATDSAASAARRNIASIGAAADAVRPSMDRLVNSFAGITAPAANRNGRAADIAAYGQELDRLQAKFDPLFAAQSRYKQKLEEIAQAERVGALTASNAIDVRLREKNSYDALINNLDRLGMARKAAAEGVVARQTITPDREADITAFFDQRDAARARHDPRFAVLTAYREKLAEIRKDLRAGAIDQDVATAAIQRHRQAALASVAAFKGRDMAGFGSGNDRFRVQNLGYQVFDIAQSSALGMPLPMVAMQQLPQIIQLYAGQGGMNAAVKDFGTIASGAAKLVTPLTVGVGALAAAATVGAASWNSYLISIKEVETAAAGLGRATAGTAEEMEAAARAGAASAGISVKAARSMEAQFLSTGRIGSENFEQLIGLSKNFATTIGVDAAAAGETLAGLFADPAKAAETLYRQYGLIDAATARQATNLARQNRQSEAQALLLDALPGRLASAEEATTKLGRAWDFVTTKGSNALDAIGAGIDKVVSAPTLEEQIADAQARFDRFSNTGSNSVSRFIRGTLNGGDDRAAEAKAALDRLTEEKRVRDGAEARRKREAERIRLGTAALDAAEGSGATANTLREQELRNQIIALETGRGSFDQGSIERNRVDTAIEAKTRALDALINRQQRASELDRLDIQIANERNPLIRAELEAKRANLELSEREISAGTLAAETARARNRVIEETISASRAQAQDMQTEVEYRSRLNGLVAAGSITSVDANRMLQEELTLRPLVTAAATAEGATKERLNQVIADLRAGYAGLAEQEKRAAGEEMLRTQNERIEQLRVEQALIGANDNVRERALARLQSEQEIRRRGLDASGDLARQIRDQADAAAKLNTQIERQAYAWDKVRSSAEGAIDNTIDSLLDGDVGGALEGLAKDVTGMFADLAIKNPLKNAALGTNYGTLDDVGGLGGIVSRLFGGGQSDPASIVSSAMGQTVGAMSVNAGTVMINGGVAGGLGLLGNAANDNSNVIKFPGAGAADASFLTSFLGTGKSANHVSGMSGDLQSGLAAMLKAAPAGIADDITINSGFRSVARQRELFQEAVAKYGSEAAARRWVAPPGNSQHNKGNAADLGFGSSTARTWAHENAGRFGLKFPMSHEPWHIETANARSMSAADALEKLAGTAGQTTENLGTLGTGFDQFGKSLTNFFPAAPSGGGGGRGFGGWLSKLFGGGLSTYGQFVNSSSSQFASAWAGGGMGLFDIGGPTGGSDPAKVAGLVHQKEFVFDAVSTAEIGVENLEALRKSSRQGFRRGGYREGGYASSIGASFPQAVQSSDSRSSVPVPIVVHNYSGQKVEGREESDGRGGRQMVMTVGDQLGSAMSMPGNGARRSLEKTFGLKTRGIAR